MEVVSVEASVDVASVEVASAEASVEACMEASVEVASVEASRACKRGSFHIFRGSFHRSFHELPQKMQIAQVAPRTSRRYISENRKSGSRYLKVSVERKLSKMNKPTTVGLSV